MLKQRIVFNGIIFLILLLAPLIGEFITATPDNVPGTGFSILLYEPFDFAYLLLAFVIFLACNAIISNKQNKSILTSVGISLGVVAIWFIVSFLSVGQLHLSLGGKL